MSDTSSHIDVLRATLNVQQETKRFNAAHNFLRSNLVTTRDTPIGRDFLFAAKGSGIRAALKDLVEIEHKYGKDLHFDYTEVGGYFLLRIAGTSDQRQDIDAYFD